MTRPRSEIIDLNITHTYPLTTRCVRCAFLMGTSNHYHLLVRVNPELVDSWCDHEVLDRWLSIYHGSNPLQAGQLQADAEEKLRPRLSLRYAIA